MKESPRALRKLVLAYESLAGEERALADAHLARNPEARKLLAELQELERAATAPVPCSGPDLEQTLTAAEEIAERASYAELLAILEARSRAETRRGGVVRGLFRPNLLLPVAAVLAAAVLLPRLLPDKPRVLDLSVAPAATSVGTVRGVVRGASAGTLRSGERFHLRFTLEKEAPVLVVHMDPQGSVAIVWPETPASRPPRLPGGVELSIPTDNDGWVLDRETGTESFFVVALDEDAYDRDTLAAGLAAAAAGAAGRDARLAAVAAHLAAAGSPQLLEFSHVD